jgi:hypothetical protein
MNTIEQRAARDAKQRIAGCLFDEFAVEAAGFSSKSEEAPPHKLHSRVSSS